MNNKKSYILYFISGTLFGLTAVVYFMSNKPSSGFLYIVLGCTFTVLGFSYKNKGVKK